MFEDFFQTLVLIVAIFSLVAAVTSFTVIWYSNRQSRREIVVPKVSAGDPDRWMKELLAKQRIPGDDK